MTPLANIFKSIATRTATTASRGRTRARKVAEPHPLLRWDIATRRSPRCAHGGTLDASRGGIRLIPFNSYRFRPARW
jgi:hypothetical protein